MDASEALMKGFHDGGGGDPGAGSGNSDAGIGNFLLRYRLIFDGVWLVLLKFVVFGFWQWMLRGRCTRSCGRPAPARW